MQTVLRFALEQSILNAFAILFGIVASVLLLGSFLDKRRTRPLVRSLVYSVGGVIGGIWGYIAFDKEPATQYLTVPVLALCFLGASFAVVAPIVYYRSRKLSQQGAGGGT